MIFLEVLFNSSLLKKASFFNAKFGINLVNEIVSKYAQRHVSSKILWLK